MNDLFSSLLHRHKGTCDVVKPRIRSRFEAETTNFAKPVDLLATDEPEEENTDARATVAQIPENHSPDAVVRQSTPPQVETQENRSVAQPLSLSPSDRVDHKPWIQPDPDISPVEKIHEQKKISPPDMSALDEHDDAPAERPPVSRKTIVERFKTTMAEPKHLLDGHLDPQISAMLDRIENLQSVVPVPQEEFYTSERVHTAGKARASDTLHKPALQTRQQAPMDDGADSVKDPDIKGPAQPETAADHRNPAQNTLLALPSWFSEMQAQSILQRNKLYSKSPPEPVINVTIGRIEVKATKRQETDRARKPKKPSGVMSLEKYLRQSERGGRR